MTIQPVSESGNTKTLTRLEYMYLLKEANDEGRIHRRLNGAVETKEQWSANNYWEIYTPELKDEFYRAYRAGYISENGLIKANGK